MADRYLLESGSPDGYLLEDGSGVLLLEKGRYRFETATSICFTDTGGTTAVTADGDLVAAVKDKSTGEILAIQATSGQRLVYRTGGGNPYIEATGASSQFLASSSPLTLSSPYGEHSVIIACHFNANSGVQSPIDGDTFGGVRLSQFLRNNAGTAESIAFDSAGNSYTDTGSSIPAALGVVLSELTSMTSTEVFVNGAGNGSTAVTGPMQSSAATLRIGASGGAGAGGTSFQTGRVYGFVIYQTLIDSATRSAEEASMTALLPTQTLTPSLFTNSQSFYAPTVSPGSVTLTPSLVTNSQSFFAPTVVSTYSLTPSLFTNSQTFFAPTVAAGPVTLTPALFTNAQSFFAPTVSPGAVTLTPGLFTNPQTFFTPSAIPGSVTLTPSLFTSSQSFFAPTVTATYTLQPNLFTNAQTFYSPVVSQTSGDQTLTPALFTNANAFYSPTVSPGPTQLLPGLFTNTQIFYAAAVVQGPESDQLLQPFLLANSQVFFTLKVTRIFLDTILVPDANLVNEGLPPAAAFGSVVEPSGQIVNAPPYPAADLA